ncbi:hypothetical protein ABZX85_45905 [Streptomyces sp. NPDC004539]|uniref:hypothetical protein n=1 Tax=Streptomyces sp. NPDC004539 TaxID=3154280 RepID=UPI00339F546F
MSVGWWLIPGAALVVIVLPLLVVRKLMSASFGRMESMQAATSSHSSASNGFQQSEQESREEFVRRHWQRSGVVADGVTLVDLYDRIRALEERVARAEQGSASPPPSD